MKPTKTPLTGISNRIGFRKVFSHALAVSRRQKQSLSVAMLDLDHFKSFNDRFGHGVGDQVLTQTGTALKSGLRECDITGRWGGEEFVVAFPQTEAANAVHALDKVDQQLRDKPIAAASNSVITFSGGVVCMSPTESLEQALLRADQLLYAAKGTGRDQVLHAMPKMESRKPRVLAAEDDPALARLLLRELAADYEVTVATDGQQAIDLAESQPSFDLVLLDFNMPRKNGLDVLKALRAQPEYARCPILMLTAISSDSIIEEAFAAGASDYIVKPYSRRALLARLQRHMLPAA